MFRFRSVGAGKPWRQQNDLLTDESELGLFRLSDHSLPYPVGWAQAAVTKNRIYLMGGWSSRVPVRKILSSYILSDGRINPFKETMIELPENLICSQVLMLKNQIYIIGGRNIHDYNMIYRATILKNGNISKFDFYSFFPESLECSQAIVTDKHVYVIGGWNQQSVSKVFKADIDNDDLLGTFLTEPTKLPIGISNADVVVTKNRVYLIGGFHDGETTNQIYRAEINHDGTISEFILDENKLPRHMSSFQIITTKDKVFLLGGWNGKITFSDIFFARINNDGTIGEFEFHGSLAEPMAFSQAVMTKNFLYLIGGENEFGLQKTIQHAPMVNSGFNDYMQFFNIKSERVYFFTRFILDWIKDIYYSRKSKR